MIGSLGVPELLFILVLALLIFGPRKLPEIGRTLGRALGEFRRATSDLKRSLDVEMSVEGDHRPPATRPSKPREPERKSPPTSSPAAEDSPAAQPEPVSDSESASDSEQERR